MQQDIAPCGVWDHVYADYVDRIRDFLEIYMLATKRTRVAVRCCYNKLYIVVDVDGNVVRDDVQELSSLFWVRARTRCLFAMIMRE